MEIRLATVDDIDIIATYDMHIGIEELANLVKHNKVFIAEDGNNFVGWLRYNLFWDSFPFINMLFCIDSERGKGYGRSLVEKFECDMKHKGYKTVMTSTQANEYAQHFYIKLGYKAIGGFLLDGESYEVVLSKKL